MFMLKKAAIVVVMVMLTGCTAHVVDTLYRHKALLKLAVVVGVNKVVEEKPQARSIIVQVATRAKVLLDTSSIDVIQVLPFALEEIKASGLPVDMQVLMGALVEAVLSEVQVYVNKVKLPKNQVTVLMSEVLGWMIAGTVL